MADKIINKRNDKEMDKTEMNNNSKNVGYLSNEAFKCYYGSFFIHSELSPFYGIMIPDDAVEQRKLGVNKERTTVPLKGFI